MPFQNAVLGVGSSGGFGHNYVRDQVCDQECRRGKVPVPVDLMKDLVFEYLGNRAVEQWNNAQKSGNIEKQESLFRKQPIADVVFFLPIFFRTLFTLFTMEGFPEKIINTQVMGGHAIIVALALYNSIQARRFSDWKTVKMEIWMTDLVTDKAKHFLNPLKSLTNYERSLVTVFIPTDREDDIKFFCEYTGFSRDKVKPLSDRELPVKAIYLNPEIQEYSPAASHEVQLNVKLSSKQQEIIKKVPHLSQAERGFNAEYSQYQVQAGDNVYSLMLGSQPTENVVKAFIEKVAELSKRGSKKPLHFFVFCGKDKENEPSLFKEMCEKLRKMDLPSNLSIIPLPFQDPQDIAKIMARSNKRFTRSGGATCFEHLAMRATIQNDPGRVFIVADVAEKVFSSQQMKRLSPDQRQEILFKAIPVWEGGNARQLHQRIQATVVCPQILDETIAEDFYDAIVQQDPELGEIANLSRLTSRSDTDAKVSTAATVVQDN